MGCFVNVTVGEVVWGAPMLWRKDQSGRYAMSRRRRLHSDENSFLIMREELN